MPDTPKPNSGRKLFFGLFIFPLVITVGMALILCGVVFLTHEDETPETLIASIKSGAPGKRWQKAFELSNELNHQKEGIRNKAVLSEIIHIQEDSARYDAKTRAYMAIALSHFKEDASVAALQNALSDPDEEIKLYAMWSLGYLKATSARTKISEFLNSDSPELRQMSAYVLGVIGDQGSAAFLKKRLDDPAVDVRWNAALSLARLKDTSGYPVLVEMTDRKRLLSDYKMNDSLIEETMINAIRGLVLIPNKESIKIFSELSKNDKSLKVRQAAIDALEIIKK